MVTNLTTVLMDLLSVTSIASVITVLVCLTSMVIFITRFNTEALLLNISPEPSPKVKIPRHDVVPVHNPFVLNLAADRSNLRDGATLSVSAEQDCKLMSGWAVDTNALNSVIKSPVHDDILHDCQIVFSHEHCAYISDAQTLGPCSEKEVYLSRPYCVDEDTIGTTIPRACYPLVVMVTADTATTTIPSSDAIVGLLSVYHLADSFCQSASHVIMQYLILSSGRLCRLEQLYSTEEKKYPRNAGDHSSHHGRKTNAIELMRGVDKRNNECLTIYNISAGSVRPISDATSAECCVVCRVADVSHVMLPCRHSCVCRACFAQINKCPMCRGDIRAYFVLDGVTFDDSNDTETQRTTTLFDRLMFINDALNNWLMY